MRSFIIPTLAFLAACNSDQGIQTITKTVPVTDTVTNTNVVTVTETITETVTVPAPETEVECGFMHYGFPNEGDYTETNLTITRLSPAVLQGYPGNAVDYTLEIVNEDCGWAVVDLIVFAITARGNNAWIEILEIEDPPMLLEFPLENEVFEGIGYNVIVEGLGEQLFYQFRPTIYAPVDAYMEPLWIAPGDSTIMNFTFDGSSDLPSGQTFDIDLLDVGWRDVTTDESITDSPYPLLTTTVTML